MKHTQYIITAVFILIFNLNLFAQIDKVKEVNARMSQGTNRGLKVLIPETSLKEAIKAWSKLMKDYESKNEKIKKETDYLSPDAKIPALGEHLINVYSQFQETTEGVYMIVFFDLGNSYINKDMHPKKVESAKKLMSSFATRVAKTAIEAEVNEESKELSKLEKELKSLTKNKDNYEAEIKDAKETIELREKSIEENLKNQNNLQNEINEQKIKVDKINEKLKKF